MRTPRPGRIALAAVLVVAATAIVALEPLPHGPVLLTLTREHGVETGDLPAVALLLVAAWLVLTQSAGRVCPTRMRRASRSCSISRCDVDTRPAL